MPPRSRTSFFANKKAIYSIAFSPDGKWLAFGGLEGAITIWDVAEKKAVSSTPAGHIGAVYPAGHSGVVYRVVFNPAGDLIASSGADNIVRLWRVEEGNLLQPPEKLEGHPAKTSIFTGYAYGYYSLAFVGSNSAASSQLISGAYSGSLVLWEVRVPQLVLLLPLWLNDWVDCVAYDPRGRKVASGAGGEGLIVITDLSTYAYKIRAVSHSLAPASSKRRRRNLRNSSSGRRTAQIWKYYARNVQHGSPS
jgi:WD40 repeat protein